MLESTVWWSPNGATSVKYYTPVAHRGGQTARANLFIQFDELNHFLGYLLRVVRLFWANVGNCRALLPDCSVCLFISSVILTILEQHIVTSNFFHYHHANRGFIEFGRSVMKFDGLVINHWENNSIALFLFRIIVFMSLLQ